jgi:hypothetical protein
MRSTYDYVILAVGWLVWVAPFVFVTRHAVKAATLDRRARWGIVLQAAGHSLLWQTRFWEHSSDRWRTRRRLYSYSTANHSRPVPSAWTQN